ncbi:MAG: hypothetical protein IPP74_03025 [Alphaproteobacteria bacterium]|nr:hypothetical protein [Alphaproteobacteria bacterium]
MAEKSLLDSTVEILVATPVKKTFMLVLELLGILTPSNKEQQQTEAAEKAKKASQAPKEEPINEALGKLNLGTMGVSKSTPLPTKPNFQEDLLNKREQPDSSGRVI